MESIQTRQAWTLLHERERAAPRSERRSEAERADAARMMEARLVRDRDKVFTEFTLCSRPYF